MFFKPRMCLLAAATVLSASLVMAVEPPQKGSSRPQLTFAKPATLPVKHKASKSDLIWRINSNPSSISFLEPLSIQRKASAPLKAPASVAGDIPTFYGSIAYLDSWNETQEPQVGIYSITAGDVVPVHVDNEILSSYGQVYAGDKYFVAVPELFYGYVVDMKYHVLDTRSWTKTVVQGDYNFNARAMAFDPVSRCTYAITYNDIDVTYGLARMDMQTYTYKKIADFSKVGNYDDWSALMCSPEGDLYGITKPGKLVKFNKLNGAFTEIGDLGISSDKMTCATIDPATGRCFYVYYSGSWSAVYEVNLEDASVTELFAVPQSAQVLSLFVPEALADDAAPAAVGDLVAVFDNGATSGKVNFTAPVVTVAGEPLSGEMDYSVEVNGVTVATGKAATGAEVEVNVAVAASGEYTFAVTFSNAAGKGSTAYATAWLGYDRPLDVTNVKLADNGGKLLLSWDAVKKGSQGAFFDPEAVTYSVVRYPDAVVVADGLKATTLEEAIPTVDSFTRISYGVTAHLGDSESGETRSNNYIAGHLLAPFSEDFSSADCMDYFTMVNANGDSKTWQLHKMGEHRALVIDYNYSSDMDDWAVLHPIRLEADKRYEIGCDAKGTTSYYTETFEVVVATGADLESLRAGTAVVPKTDTNAEDYSTYSGVFIPAESGLYYVAVHGCSKSGQNKLYVDNIFVSEGVSTKAPAAVSSLEITPDSEGKLSATLSFVVPDVDMSGAPLAEVSYVAVSRDGEEIGRVNAPAVGSSQTLVDNSPVNGLNVYTVTAVNSYGSGKAVTAQAYVGVYAPVAVADVQLTRGANTGETKLTWSAAAYDVAGHKLDPSTVSYNVVRNCGKAPAKVVAEGIAECSFTEQAVDTDAEQDFIYYSVEAVNICGNSELAHSNICPVGRPYATPAHESFDLRKTQGIWSSDTPDGSFTSWDLYDPMELPFETFDGNGIAAAQASYAGETNQATLYSGLFDLSGLVKPVLTFYVLDVDYENTLTVCASDGMAWKELATVKLGEEDFEWHKVTVELTPMKDKTVCFGFVADCGAINILAIDNMRVTDDFTYNLTAMSISAPKTIAPNELFDVKVQYENSGKEAVDDYAVALICEGEQIAETTFGTIAPATIGNAEFSVSVPVITPENTRIFAVLRALNDEYAMDDTIASVEIKVNRPDWPLPGELAGEQQGDEVILHWSAPDMTDIKSHPSTDGLENLVPFSIGLAGSDVENDNLGQWRVYDLDGLETYAAGGGSLPEYPNQKKPQAFMVFNGTIAGDEVAFGSHAYSHQMFMCMAGKPAGGVTHNDDWLVSPELGGMEQTVSFFARSVSAAQYGVDTFEFLYSTTGYEVSDFTCLETTQTTGEWTEYSFTVPEGTRYFAVRCISADKYAFLVDDFTMITADDVVTDLELIGYHVYCDNKRITDKPVAETSYAHAGLSDGIHSYNVSCVYNYGESAPSNTIEVDFGTTGVDAVGTGTARIVAANGAITVYGAEGIEVCVCDALGRVLHSAVANSGVTVVEVPAGVYLVRVGNSATKVMLR